MQPQLSINQQSVYPTELRLVEKVGARPLRYAALPDNYRSHIITKKKHFRWWNVFDDMCRMGRWSFWF